MTIEMLKEIKGEFEKTFADFKKENDKSIDEKSALNTEKVEKLQDQLDSVETKYKELQLSMDASENEQAVDEMKLAVQAYIKGGESMMDAETKAKLIVGDATQGGYLVEPEFDRTIVKKQTEINRIRQFARVTTINSSSMPYPKRETLLKGSWTSEQGDVQDDASTYGQGEIQVHELDVNVPISNKLLQDSFVNMEQEIQMDVAEAFAFTEGEAFVSGDDVNKPEGILSNTLIERVETENSLAIDSNDLYNLQFELITNYVQGANFFGNRRILRDFRKLKDSDGQNIVQLAQSAGIQYSILGTDFIETPSVVGDVLAGNEILFYGDLFRGYRIVDRIGMTVLRDPYTAKKQKMIEFLFCKRVGGKVILPEAIKILKVKA